MWLKMFCLYRLAGKTGQESPSPPHPSLAALLKQRLTVAGPGVAEVLGCHCGLIPGDKEDRTMLCQEMQNKPETLTSCKQHLLYS